MWFEELDFIENPFGDFGHIRLVGYENILDDILYNISAGNIVFIEGKKGYGKTSLLNRAINQFKGQGRVVYINGEKVQDPNIENVLMGRAGTFSTLFNKKPKNMVILMDDIGVLSKKNLERLKYFYDQNYIRSIIFTGSDYNKVNLSNSLKQRISAHIKLNTFKESDAIEMIQIRLGETNLLEEDHIKSIYKKSNSPKDFLGKCEEVCKLVVEKKQKKANKDIIDKVLNPKAKPKIEESKEIKKEVKIKPKKKAVKKKAIKKTKKETKVKEKPMQIEEEKPKSIEVKEEKLEVKDKIEIKEELEEKPVKLIYEDIADKYY